MPERHREIWIGREKWTDRDEMKKEIHEEDREDKDTDKEGVMKRKIHKDTDKEKAKGRERRNEDTWRK